MKHIKRKSGFFFGLNDQPKEQAFLHFLDTEGDTLSA